ncbi:MAG: hypothetical protein IPO91_11025 [Chloroflexi bacterium]|nr:hypothetical protein [Chloroflexota bacterium]
MRLNRSTIIFIVALLAFIVVVLLLNQNQAAAPGDTTVTPTSAPVALLPGVDNTTLARLEVRDNTTGERIVLTKATADSAWLYDNTTRAEPGVETEVSGTQQADPTVLSALIPLLTNLNSADSFEDANLANFGLTSPLYTVLATTYDGAVFLVHIGGQSRVNPRYYVIVEQAGNANVGGTEEPQAIGTQEIGAADATAEATVITDLTEAASVGAEIEATNAAVGTQVAQADATAEASAEPQATGTQEILPADATAEATVEATVEATPEALPTIEPTLAPLAEPLVALEGTFQIYVVQKSTLDRFINLITTPPIFVPTPTPTTDLGLLSIPSTDVPQGSLSTPEVTLEVTAEATAAP